MHCIADLRSIGRHRVGDRVFGVWAIVLLPSCTRHPDDAVEAIGAYLIDDGLEEIVEGTVALLAIGAEHVDRLVGKLDAEPS